MSGLTFAGTYSVSVQNDTLISGDFQLSFITPAGTNGLEFNEVENKIS
ncbi:MAG: hypothetical protein ACJAZ2_001828, partial [Glaciecola sp.]